MFVLAAVLAGLLVFCRGNVMVRAADGRLGRVRYPGFQGGVGIRRGGRQTGEHARPGSGVLGGGLGTAGQSGGGADEGVERLPEFRGAVLFGGEVAGQGTGGLRPGGEPAGDLLRVARERFLPAHADSLVGRVQGERVRPGSGLGVGGHDVVAGRGTGQRPVVADGPGVVASCLAYVGVGICGGQRLGLGVVRCAGAGRLAAQGEGAAGLAESCGQAADAPVAGAVGPGPGEVPGLEVGRPAEPLIVQQPAQLLVVLVGAADQRALVVMLDDQPGDGLVGGIAGSGLFLVLMAFIWDGGGRAALGQRGAQRRGQAGVTCGAEAGCVTMSRPGEGVEAVVVGRAGVVGAGEAQPQGVARVGRLQRLACGVVQIAGGRRGVGRCGERAAGGSLGGPDVPPVGSPCLAVGEVPQAAAGHGLLPRLAGLPDLVVSGGVGVCRVVRAPGRTWPGCGRRPGAGGDGRWRSGVRAGPGRQHGPDIASSGGADRLVPGGALVCQVVPVRRAFQAFQDAAQPGGVLR